MQEEEQGERLVSTNCVDIKAPWTQICEVATFYPPAPRPTVEPTPSVMRPPPPRVPSKRRDPPTHTAVFPHDMTGLFPLG